MSKEMLVQIFVICILLSATFAPVSSMNGSSELIPEEKNWSVNSSNGVIFEVELQNSGKMSIEARNTNHRTVHTGFVVRVDDENIIKENFKMSGNRKVSWELNTTKGIVVDKENHTIQFSTYGGSRRYNFTKDIDSASADRFPKPYIGDINVTTGTVDGEPSTVANVTVVNPGPQTYPMLLLVNTEGTDGSFYGVAIPTYSNETFTVELLEPVGDKIAGEARLYTEKPRKREGALDQVEFVGSPATETRQWNTSYEPVRGPWSNDPYEYENESIHTDTDARENLNPFDDPERRKYANAAALTVGGLLVLAAYRKLTRPN